MTVFVHKGMIETVGCTPSAVQPNAQQAIEQTLYKKVIPSLGRNPERSSKMSLSANINHGLMKVSPSEVNRFVGYLLAGMDDKVSGQVNALQRKEYSATSIVLNLLCPAARVLGDKWCSDECSFGDVTLGLASLHKSLQDISFELGREFPNTGRGHSILFTSMPGDTHIFGVSVLKAFFEANGWQVDALYDVSSAELIDCVASSKYDIAGISVSCDADINDCKSLVSAFRKRSANKHIKLMVGGLPFILNHRLLGAVGADVFAENALNAIELAAACCGDKQLAMPVSGQSEDNLVKPA